MESARKKNPNWSGREVEVLVNSVEYFGTIKARFKSTLCKIDKTKAWNIVTNRVNIVSTIVRTATEVKKKWTDMNSVIKKKGALRRSEVKKTGGGEVSVLPPTVVEEKVVSLMADESIEGVKGSVDTFDLQGFYPVVPIDLIVPPIETALVNLMDTQDNSAEPIVPATEQMFPIHGAHSNLVVSTSSLNVSSVTEPPKYQKIFHHMLSYALNPVVDFEERRLLLDREQLENGKKDCNLRDKSGQIC